MSAIKSKYYLFHKNLFMLTTTIGYENTYY
jgi:hypothetical protein